MGDSESVSSYSPSENDGKDDDSDSNSVSSYSPSKNDDKDDDTDSNTESFTNLEIKSKELGELGELEKLRNKIEENFIDFKLKYKKFHTLLANNNYDEIDKLTLENANEIKKRIQILLPDIEKNYNYLMSIEEQEIETSPNSIKKIKEEINKILTEFNDNYKKSKIIEEINLELNNIENIITRLNKKSEDDTESNFSEIFPITSDDISFLEDIDNLLVSSSSIINANINMEEQTTKIILQNIDNINEYYGINDDVKIILEKNINMYTYDNKIQYTTYDQKVLINKSTLSNRSANGGGDNQNTEKILKALNKFLAKHKYIVKNKLYTLYDKYTDNVVCIIADFDNIYIIQIKEEFYKNNDKILTKYNKDDIKKNLEPLYKSNTPNNLQKLLS